MRALKFLLIEEDETERLKFVRVLDKTIINISC